MEEKTLIEHRKSPILDPMNNVKLKAIDEIVPLINQTSYQLKTISQPIVTPAKL